MNSVCLLGRLTRDSELRYTPNGTAVLNSSLAIGERRKQGEEWIEETSFFDFVLFGKLAEGVSKYCLKGKQIAINGRLKQERWQQDGQNRSRVVVIVDNLQLLGGNDNAKQPEPQKQAGQYQQPHVVSHDAFDFTPATQEQVNGLDIKDDIPF